MTDVFSDVEITPLQYGGDNYPQSVSTLQLGDSVIVISDNNNIAHIFNRDGNPISCSSKMMGEGPEEFPFSMCATFNPHNHTIEVVSPYKMYVYDLDMNFIRSIKLPTYVGKGTQESLFFTYIYDISKNIHAVRPTDSDSKIHIYDSEKNQITAEFDYGDDIICSINSQSKQFFEITDELTYFVPGAMTYFVYSFSKRDYTIKKEIELSMGDKGITRQYIKDLNLDKASLAYHLLSSEKDMLISTMPMSDKLLTTLKHGNTLRDMYYVFIDRKTGNKIRVNIYENRRYKAPMFNNVSEGYAYAVIAKEDLLERPAVLLDKAAPNLRDFDDDTLLLLKYKFHPRL